MLHRFKNLLKRFQRDERGAFLVLFGVLAIVLIATSGAVVDFTQIEQARTRAQNALDAAALGLQPHVFDTPAKTEAWFMTEATNLLVERLGDADIASSVTGASINVRNGQLILNARITVPTSFVTLVGVPDVTASLVAEATRKRLNLEIAMVLDNSGSMGQFSRMTELKKAANNATDILFDYQSTQPNVFISIVPFNAYVNVGTANRTASWMSQTGASSHSTQNFDDDDRDSNTFTGKPANSQRVNRWALYDGLRNKTWAGCVEARATPFDTDDTVPDNAVPDTMFQPLFAPDGANGSSVQSYLSDTGGSCSRVAPVWTETLRKSNCTTSGNWFWGAREYYDNCNRTASQTARSLRGVNGSLVNNPPATRPADNSEAAYYNTATCSFSYSISGNNISRTETCTYNFSTRELMERLCKYDNVNVSGNGPNSDCVSTAILPLTNQRDTVKGRITAMSSGGYTNIEQGTIWGFHALSPTEPLTEGRAYDEATSKIMIVMTDGENMFDLSEYTAWGFRGNKRLLTEATTPKESVATDAQWLEEVDRRTVVACTNAKARGVIVYTIGLATASTSNQAKVEKMLTDCASPSRVEGGVTRKFWYFPKDATELTDVFKEIAEQLSELRLAQ